MPAFAAELIRAALGPAQLTAKIQLVYEHDDRLEIDVQLDTGLIEAPDMFAIHREQTHQSGVYAIVNVRDMRAYIGRSEDIELRRRQHLSRLESGQHTSPHLQSDWRATRQGFAFTVLDPAPEDTERAERYRLRIYATNFERNGYNQGEGFDHGPHPPRHEVVEYEATVGEPPPDSVSDTADNPAKDTTSETHTPLSGSESAVASDTSRKKSGSLMGWVVLLLLLLAWIVLASG